MVGSWVGGGGSSKLFANASQGDTMHICVDNRHTDSLKHTQKDTDTEAG